MSGFKPVSGGGGAARVEVLVSGSPFVDLAALEAWSQSNQSELFNEVKPETDGDGLRVALAVVDGLDYQWGGANKVYSSDSWFVVDALNVVEKNAVYSVIDLPAGSVPVGKDNKLVASIQRQDGVDGMSFDGEITTTKGTVNIGRGLSVGESGLAPIFTDVLESESSLPVLSNLNNDGTTLQPYYIKRYDLTNTVLQPLDSETAVGYWEATVPVTSTRVITKLRTKFGANATGIRLTLRYAENQSEKDGIVLYQSHTDAEFNSGAGFSVENGLFEVDLGKEAAKVINGKYVCILVEQSPLGTGQIQLLGGTLDIGGVTQFYAYLEQTYVLEEAISISSQPVNWKKVSADYTSVSGDMYLDCRPSVDNITVTIDGTYPDDWSGLFIYNESRRKDVEVRKANGDLVTIVDRKEGKAIYLDNGLFQSTTIMGRPDGISDVVEFDVSTSANRSVDNTFVGKLINITQSGSPVPVAMQITLDPHDNFNTGDEIKISASDAYVNYYFAVYYSNAQGAQRASYPNNSIVLVRTDSGWNVSMDGSTTKTAIRPRNQLRIPYSGDDPDNRPVQAFVFANHPAVGYEENDEGNRIMVIDFYKIAGDPNIESVDIAHAWTTEEFPTTQNIKDALLFVQTDDDKTATFDVSANALPLTTMYAKRSESSSKYLFFAYPADFFVDANGDVLEPTVVNTGSGNSADWVVSTVDVDGINYRVQRSPTQNFGDDLPNCKLIQTS